MIILSFNNTYDLRIIYYSLTYYSYDQLINFKDDAARTSCTHLPSFQINRRLVFCFSIRFCFGYREEDWEMNTDSVGDRFASWIWFISLTIFIGMFSTDSVTSLFWPTFRLN